MAELVSVERIIGTLNVDVFTASGSIVYRDGAGGEDVLTGSTRRDTTLIGGAGGDRLEGQKRDDRIFDYIEVETRRFFDPIRDQDIPGIVNPIGGQDADTILGGKGDDTIFSLYGPNDIRAGGDNDLVLIFQATGSARVGSGDDTLSFLANLSQSFLQDT